MNFVSPSDDGYSDDPVKCVQNTKKNMSFYSKQGVEVVLKRGYTGIVDSGSDDIHMTFGMIPYTKKYAVNTNVSNTKYVGAPGTVPYHYWLEDKQGNIYDHADPMSLRIAGSVGADISRVFPFQRFVGLSKEELFEEFGVWYSAEN